MFFGTVGHPDLTYGFKTAVCLHNYFTAHSMRLHLAAHASWSRQASPATSATSAPNAAPRHTEQVNTV